MDPLSDCRQGDPVLFFDLDGTLTDPKPGITGCIQYALEQLGHPVPSKDELEWCIGPPLLANFTRLVGAGDAPAAVVHYRERFGDVGMFENEIYQGIEAALHELQARGARLHVASSKPLVFVRRILDHFDLSRYFEAAYGSELDGTRTDKSELLRYALGETRVLGSRAIMVGDRGFDAVGARSNGMGFVGALYGYGSREELQASGADRFVERPSHLTAVLLERADDL